MQKVKTVKILSFLILILLITISCQKEQQNDDQHLLELVLQSKQNQFNKAIILNPKGEIKTVLDFFRLRQTKERTFTFEYKNKDTVSAQDTLTAIIGTPVYRDKKITGNDYLMNGKGIDEKVEAFLKDSFNYKQERIVNWLLPTSAKNISLKEQGSDTKNIITISTPVYNLKKNKAIVLTFYRSSKNTAQHSIHFIEKHNDSWNIIYSEKGEMFLDLRIE